MNNLISLHLDRASSFNREHFRTGLIGTSDCNNYIPLYSLYCHNLLLFENKEDVKIMEYNFPVLPNSIDVCRQYGQLISNLKNGMRPMKYIFTLQGETHEFNIITGMLYDNSGKVLLCLALNTEYVFNTTKEVLSTAPDVTQFILITSTELDLPIYKNIKKKLTQMYIEEYKTLGVDIVVTSRSNDWLFRNNFEEPKFKSVTKLIKHLQEEVPKSLLID